MKLVDKNRLFTGLGLVLVALLLVWIDSLLMIWLSISIIVLVSTYEMQKLIGSSNDLLYVYQLLMLIALFFTSHQILIPFIGLIFFVSLSLIAGSLEKKQMWLFVYPTLPLFALYQMYEIFGISSILYLVIIVALSDTGAYFMGKMFGKTPFSPISPNKTKEGFLGGLILATVVGSLCIGAEYSYAFGVVFALFVSLASTFGDLFESYLKREAGVKDSGAILPGHGGFLDRFDGYLFAVIPALFLLLQL